MIRDPVSERDREHGEEDKHCLKAKGSTGHLSHMQIGNRDQRRRKESEDQDTYEKKKGPFGSFFGEKLRVD